MEKPHCYICGIECATTAFTEEFCDNDTHHYCPDCWEEEFNEKE